MSRMFFCWRGGGGGGGISHLGVGKFEANSISLADSQW